MCIPFVLDGFAASSATALRHAARSGWGLFPSSTLVCFVWQDRHRLRQFAGLERQIGPIGHALDVVNLQLPARAAVLASPAVALQNSVPNRLPFLAHKRPSARTR